MNFYEKNFTKQNPVPLAQVEVTDRYKVDHSIGFFSGGYRSTIDYLANTALILDKAQVEAKISDFFQTQGIEDLIDFSIEDRFLTEAQALAKSNNIKLADNHTTHVFEWGDLTIRSNRPVKIKVGDKIQFCDLECLIQPSEDGDFRLVPLINDVSVDEVEIEYLKMNPIMV